MVGREEDVVAGAALVGAGVFLLPPTAFSMPAPAFCMSLPMPFTVSQELRLRIGQRATARRMVVFMSEKDWEFSRGESIPGFRGTGAGDPPSRWHILTHLR